MEKQNKIPPILLVLFLVKAIVYYWLWLHALPFATSDVLVMQQPAVEKLFKGSFTAAAQFQRYSYFDTVFAYPPLYTLLIYCCFYLFGFSIYTALAFDFIIEYLVSIIATLYVYKNTHKIGLGIFILITVSVLFFPIGRPEMLGILCGLLSCYFLLMYDKIWLASIFVGLSLASTPISASPFLLFFLYKLKKEEINFYHFIGSMLLIIIIPIAIWSYTVGFNLEMGFIQLKEMGTLVPNHHLVEIFNRNPLFVYALLMVVVFLLFELLQAIIRKKENKLLSITLALFILSSLILLHWFKRPEYDYRFMLVVSLVICLAYFPLHLKSLFQPILFSSIIILFGVSYFINVGKFVLVPFLWANEKQSYAYNEKYVNSVIPKDATVGGAGNLFYLIKDGRTFYGNRNLAGEFMPEYMIFKGIDENDSYTYVITNKWKSILSLHYTEVQSNDSLYYSTNNQARNSILNRFINIQDDDFRVRIWKLKRKNYAE